VTQTCNLSHGCALTRPTPELGAPDGKCDGMA
jgi:hypothetical protein